VPHAYLSLGSNLGDRESRLQQSIARLRDFGDIVHVSSFYETEPIELREQPWFLNCVVQLETELNPPQLLSGIQKIEAELGRTREIEKGPRTIDLDIVVFGSAVIESGALSIPHPAMHKRRFVLAPLAEIAPELRHPILNKTITQLLSELESSDGAVQRLGSK
jgi:2-amino-4-hydroxy-6-hydroxymethyldihydropteridine diphosphokinase